MARIAPMTGREADGDGEGWLITTFEVVQLRCPAIFDGAPRDIYVDGHAENNANYSLNGT